MTSLRATAKPFVPGSSTPPTQNSRTSSPNQPANPATPDHNDAKSSVPALSFTNNGVINPNSTSPQPNSAAASTKRLSAKAPAFIPPVMSAAAPAFTPTTAPSTAGSTNGTDNSNDAPTATADEPKQRTNSIVAERRKAFEQSSAAPPPAIKSPTQAVSKPHTDDVKAPTPTPAASTTTQAPTNTPSTSTPAPAAQSTPAPAAEDAAAAAKAKKLQGLGLPLTVAPIRRTGTAADQRVRKLKEDVEPVRSKPVSIKTDSGVVKQIANDTSASSGFGNDSGEKIEYDLETLLEIREHCYSLDDALKSAIPEGILLGSGELDMVRKAGSGWRDAKQVPGGAGKQAQLGAGGFRPGSNIGQATGLRPGSSLGINTGGGKSLDRSMMGTVQQTEKRVSPQNKQNHKGGKPKRGDAPMDIEIAPLEQSENAYKLLKTVEPNQQLMRSVNAILNKLTPEKFDILVDRILELNITTAALLRDVVNSLFEKAVAEPTFSPTYAQFSVHLSEKLPTFTDEETNEVTTFKRLLLNTCQNEFEVATQSNNDTDAMSDIDKSHVEATTKRRQLGTIRFIGELYSRKMLAVGIMRMCVALLLGDVQHPNEESIEALCKLLSTIGASLDTQSTDAQQFINATFEALKTLSTQNDLLSSRIRFMIIDIIELRQRNWVHRIKQEEQKTLSQVHAESGLNVARPGGAAAAPSFSNDVRVSSKSLLGTGSKLTTQQRSQVGKFDRYSVNKPKMMPAKQPEVVELKASNAFDMLNADEDADVDDTESSTATSAPSKSAAAKKSTGGYSEEQALQKVKSIVSDYFNSNDTEDAILSISELPSQLQRSDVIYHTLLTAYEHKDSQRDAVVQLLCTAHKQQKLSTSDFDAALQHLLVNAEDYALDNPKIFVSMAATLSVLIQSGILTIAFIGKQQCAELLPPDDIKLAIQTMQHIQKAQNAQHLTDLLSKSKYTLKPFYTDKFGADYAKQQLKSAGLESVSSIVL